MNEMRKQVIYETKGRAKEFCELAINLYSGCAHHCTYCYGADVTHNPDFFKEVKARVAPADIEWNAVEWAHNASPVLLCFVTDPYQPMEKKLKLTRQAIEILNYFDLGVHILTKAGDLAQRDFDLLSKNPKNVFATTLTLLKPEDSLKWEPNAGTPLDRMLNLTKAKEKGIKTWVSLEPVIDPEQTLRIIKITHSYVDHYKVGTLNYDPYKDIIDWKDYGYQAAKLLTALKKPFYIKKDLAKILYGKESNGFWVGEQPA